MTEIAPRPLSEKPFGYLLAVGGGILGGPLGLITSPAVLFGLNKLMKPKDEKIPNRFLTWALIGIVGAPLSFAPFMSNSTGDNGTPAVPSETTKPEVSQVVPLGVADQVRDDRSLKVTSSEVFTSISSGNQFIAPIESKGGKLVGIFMSIKNTGKESGNMFWTQFQLEDSQGRKYDDIEDFTEIMTVNSWAKNQGLAEAGDQLFPGATANTVAVFRVAPDAQGLKLIVNENKIFAIK
jgi:hypothetical protein